MLSNERRAAERLSFKLLAAIVIFLVASWLVPLAWDKLSPFIIAIPIAAMLQPVIRFFYKRMKISRAVTSLILVVLLLIISFLFMRWLIDLLIETANQVLRQPRKNIFSTAADAISQAIENLKVMIAWEKLGPNVQKQLETSVSSLTGNIMDIGTDIATKFIDRITGLPYFVIYISFLAMGLFFISRDYDDIRSYLPGGRRRRQDSSTTKLTNSAIRSLIGYLRVQCTFSIMVLIVSLVFLNAFHFDYASPIAVLAGFLELIPMIGSGLLYILMGIIFLLTGSTSAGIQVLLLTGFLQLTRRLLEPKLMSNSIGITPLESLIGMFAGMRFGGILGLVSGPVLMSIIVGAFHGPGYASLKSDIRCIRLYFHKRWANDPDQPQDAEPSPDDPPEGEDPGPAE